MSYDATTGLVAMYKDGVSLTLTVAPFTPYRPSMITPRLTRSFLGRSQSGLDPFFGESELHSRCLLVTQRGMRSLLNPCPSHAALRYACQMDI
jgi:hypothetical protein